MSAHEDSTEERLKMERPGPISVKFQMDGRWLDGTYEVRGPIMVVHSGSRSISACIGLLNHKKLARALLIHLEAKGRCAHLPTPAPTPCAVTSHEAR